MPYYLVIECKKCGKEMGDQFEKNSADIHLDHDVCEECMETAYEKDQEDLEHEYQVAKGRA